MRRHHQMTAVCLALSLLGGGAALAQSPPSTTNPQTTAPPNPTVPVPPKSQVTPPEQIAPPANGSGNMSQNLSRDRGAVKPQTVDPGMVVSPPPSQRGSTPVIPPPGSPGGNQSVIPK